jgi:hypothetical protein
MEIAISFCLSLPPSSSSSPSRWCPSRTPGWERLGKYHGTLTPGLNFLVPFIDKVAYKHSLKEIPLDVPSQVCITATTPSCRWTASCTSR